MSPATRRRRAPLLLPTLALLVSGAGLAEAQLMVQLKLNKQDFLAYESIRATVTVHNRAGNDVILSGPRGTGWLNFDIYSRGQLVSPRKRNAYGTSAFVLGAGKSITRTVDLGRSYPLADTGNYSVSAAVYFPPEKTYFSSVKKRLTVSDSRAFWKQSVGVSQGRGELASFREFSLHQLRGQTRNDIYVRLRDTKTPRVYCCFSLGRYINVRKPQATVDSQNRLHVLHMSSPRYYTHARISPEGTFLGRDFYREVSGNRPSLAIDPGGVVKVVGGVKHDPDKPQTIATKPRSITERPPGLPR